MALNINDKKSLGQQILPEVDFNITTTGVTVHASNRLSMPRVIPFDNQGKCKECKSSEVELDFVVTKEGVTLFCTRMKGSRFVPFDSIHDLPDHCFFKIKNKGRVFNVEHGQQAPVICHPLNFTNQKEIQAEPPPQKMSKLEPEKEYTLKETLSEIYAYLDWIVPSSDVAEGMIGRVKKAGGMSFEAFLDALSAATSFTTNPNGNNISPVLLEVYQKNSAKHNKIFAPKNPENRTIPFSVLLEILAAAATFLGDSELPSKPKESKEEEVKSETVQAPSSDQYEAFYESMKAATTGIPDQPKRVKELKEQAKQMKEEEEAAIASITPSIPNKPISPPNVKFF